MKRDFDGDVSQSKTFVRPWRHHYTKEVNTKVVWEQTFLIPRKRELAPGALQQPQWATVEECWVISVLVVLYFFRWASGNIFYM